jgi:pyruvate dehydrogenase E1 component
MGGGFGQCVKALGVEHFGQTGTIGDLYRHHRIDTNAIIETVQRIAPEHPVRHRKMAV